MHAVILFAGFFSPYDPTVRIATLPFVPPTRLHFSGCVSGHFHLRPFIRAWDLPALSVFTSTKNPATGNIQSDFFVTGPEYKVAGLFSAHIHLFGVDEPAQIFLGRQRQLRTRSVFPDPLRRTHLVGGRLAGHPDFTFAGIAAGHHLRLLRELDRRIADAFRGTFLVLPWLYLLLAVRAFLPLHISPVQTFFLLVAVIGSVGWARPARLVRGIVLSAKTRKYVAASRGFGASDAYILRRHVLAPYLWSLAHAGCAAGSAIRHRGSHAVVSWSGIERTAAELGQSAGEFAAIQRSGFLIGGCLLQRWRWWFSLLVTSP